MNPLHPYTQGLIGSIPVLGEVKDELDVIPGIGAQPDQPAAGLPLCAALPGARQAQPEDLHRDEARSLHEVEPGHTGALLAVSKTPRAHRAPLQSLISRCDGG